jgi:hypothetical protein
METSFTNQAVSSISLWLQLREQDYIADAFLAGEHHAQAVNANCRRLSPMTPVRPH